MVIDFVTIELKRTDEQATLLCQGRPLGVVMKITRTELEHLALYLANEVGLWRDAQLEAEGAEAQTAQTAPGSASSP